ncbi:unnamed protein product [Closterium sp. NIES-53]
MGAVLAQMKGEEEKVVAFASRSCNAAEANYSSYEGEGLAVVWAVKHFRVYLHSRKFTPGDGPSASAVADADAGLDRAVCSVNGGWPRPRLGEVVFVVGRAGGAADRLQCATTTWATRSTELVDLHGATAKLSTTGSRRPTSTGVVDEGTRRPGGERQLEIADLVKLTWWRRPG